MGSQLRMAMVDRGRPHRGRGGRERGMQGTDGDWAGLGSISDTVSEDTEDTAHSSILSVSRVGNNETKLLIQENH